MIRACCGSLLLWACLVSAVHAAPEQDELSVVVRGNKRTRPQIVERVVRRYYDAVHKDSSLDQIQSQLSRTTLFAKVAVTATSIPEVVFVDLQERFSISPVFVPYISPDLQSLIVGFQDANFLGRLYSAGLSAGFRNSSLRLDPLGSVWIATKNIAGTGWGTETQFEIQARTVPVYTANSFAVEFASFDRQYSAHMATNYQTRSPFAFGLMGQVHASESEALPQFVSSSTSTHATSWAPELLRFRYGVSVLASDLKFEEPNFRGYWAQIEQWAETVQQLGTTHFDTQLTAKYFLVFAKKWLNFASRIQLRATSAEEFYLLQSAGGSYGLIRGFPERYFRAKVLGALNLEMRAKIFQRKWTAAQVVAFFDQLTAVHDHSSSVVGNAYANAAGFGIYGWSPQFSTGSVRLDLAWPLAGPHSANSVRYSFSLTHYF
jgi:outer membrane protein assembly factor BamA